MPTFLIDVNLPYFFALWNNDNFIHQRDVNDEMSDAKIWEYAIDNELIIVSKDADFSKKIIYNDPPPRVIHIKFGNLKMKEFHDVISANWSTVVDLIMTHKLINIYTDRIEAIK
jgi:predicted nuclease of predicted toxin-antitoxin system